MILKIGDKAPDINLPSSDGQTFKLSALKSQKNVVLYFYPKDDTPGCTVQACGVRDNYKEILKHNAVIVGISPDDIKKHNKFVQKFELPFPLLANTEKKTCEDYGVWVEKSMYGKKYMGVARTTFVIGKDGRIAQIFEKVKPEAHAQDVIEALKALK